MTDQLFDDSAFDDRKPWQRSAYPPNLYAGGPPEEPKAEATTSHEAAERIRPGANSIRAQVFDRIARAVDGCTDDELERVLEMRHQTVSARRRELVLLRLIKDSGQRRNTRSGRKAAVWIVA